METFSVLSSFSLPGLIVGVTDAQRLSLLQMALRINPLASLTSDAMLSSSEMRAPDLGR